VTRPSFDPAAIPLVPGRSLVGWGGRLDVATLRATYRHGLFPWYGEDDPLLWWCPDPRAVLPLESLHVSRRLRRTLRRPDLVTEPDGDVETVARACAERRADGCWIHEAMVEAYAALARAGDAHALEVRRAGRLVGGIYGVAVGAVFCAESMFHRETDMSKVAFVRLVEHLRARGFALLDAQMPTPHLATLGVEEIPRAAYLARLAELRDATVRYTGG
jgi:leucyl/phenylalanyl-tRNA--protein transferase